MRNSKIIFNIIGLTTVVILLFVSLWYKAESLDYILILIWIIAIIIALYINHKINK